MPKAKIAAREPIEKKLEAGKQYSWCACGLSSSQPFCDGSHSSTEIEPKEFSEDNDQSVALCLCKQTGTPPYCDGTHAHLPDDVDELEMEATHEGGDAEAGPPGPRNTAEEPHVEFIHRLATDGLEASGSHGPTVAMGVPRDQIPSWDGLQLLTAQLARQPLGEDVAIDTAVIVGPKSSLPLQLNIPLLVTDMSYGALSPEAKISLAKGAEQAGTAICSGEGGMLPEEQQESSRYLFELGTGEFGYRDEVLRKVQAFHFKAGQAAKTGVGGHLPAEKVDERIAKVRRSRTGGRCDFAGCVCRSAHTRRLCRVCQTSPRHDRWNSDRHQDVFPTFGGGSGIRDEGGCQLRYPGRQRGRHRRDPASAS